jgi:GMP synthase-like glutamine amidotransferase
VLNNYVDQVKCAAQFEKLCVQVRTNCGADIERVGYREFDVEYVRTKSGRFDAIVMSGSEALYNKPEQKAGFLTAIEATRMIDLPLLGICGGHQLIGMAYGEQVVNLGKTIKSYKDVDILVNDLIFEGLPRTVSLMESHEEMVQKMLLGFQLLAESPDTAIEAFRKLKLNPIRCSVSSRDERRQAPCRSNRTVKLWPINKAMRRISR